MLPPLGRFVEGGVLAGGQEVQPNYSPGLVCEEGFECPNEIQKHDLPRVAHEPRGGLHARIAFLLHLSAQGKFRGGSEGHDDCAFDVAGGLALKCRFAAVFVDDVA